MTAKDYLKSNGLKNPPLDSGISGGGDAPRIYASDIIEEYARIQIDKDRKRIKEAYYSDTDFGDFNNLLKSTKINLEL